MSIVFVGFFFHVRCILLNCVSNKNPAIVMLNTVVSCTLSSPNVFRAVFFFIHLIDLWNEKKIRLSELQMNENWLN